MIRPKSYAICALGLAGTLQCIHRNMDTRTDSNQHPPRMLVRGCCWSSKPYSDQVVEASWLDCDRWQNFVRTDRRHTRPRGGLDTAAHNCTSEASCTARRSSWAPDPTPCPARPTPGVGHAFRPGFGLPSSRTTFQYLQSTKALAFNVMSFNGCTCVQPMPSPTGINNAAGMAGRRADRLRCGQSAGAKDS
jgi:hypothetical protein